MKFKHFLFAAALFATISCSKEETIETPVKADYSGTLTVSFQGNDFTNEGIAVTFEPSEDGNTAALLLHKVKFVPQMPVTIDVTVPDVTLRTTASGTTLYCERVVPLAMGGEIERYTVTNLTGNLSDGKLTFSLNFGDFPASYKGMINP